MTVSEQGLSDGLELHATLHSSNASAGLELPLYSRLGRRVHIAPRNQLMSITLALVTAAGGDSYLFADYAGRAAITAASTSANTLTVAGDLAEILAVDDTFYVQGSTGNDGELTVTAIAYDLQADTTTITVASITNATADGVLAWVYYAISAADAGANTFTIAGDVTAKFKVGRLFKVDGSTGNDDSGSNYTVTAVSYDADTQLTTITVSSVADGTDDGFIIPQATRFEAFTLLRGTYAVSGGHSLPIPERYDFQAGYTLYGVAPAGVVDFEAFAKLKKNILRS